MIYGVKLRRGLGTWVLRDIADLSWLSRCRTGHLACLAFCGYPYRLFI